MSPNPDPEVTEQLKKLCVEHSDYLHLQDTKVKGDVFLAALLFCESKFGKNCKPKAEAAYTPEGKHFDAELRRLHNQYGRGVSCSWGPWQIMYVTALDLGYQGPPEDLAKPEVSIFYVVKYLNEGIAAGAICVSQLADFYNVGKIKARKVPTGYVRTCISAYNGLAKAWLEQD